MAGKKHRKDKSTPTATEIVTEALDTIEAKERKKVTGRPKSIQSAAELEERMIGYLNEMGRWGLPSKAGLAFALGITRDTLNRYEKEEGFSDILSHWYAYFEDRWVQNLARPNATGTIFYLKNTYGYRDVIENPGGNTVINFTMPKEMIERYEPPKQVEATIIEADPTALIDSAYAIAPESEPHREG